MGANAALEQHRRPLSPEAKAAVPPPGAKTATLSPEAQAATVSPEAQADAPSPEVKAATLSPEALAAMIEQGSLAARECLVLIRQLADGVWPRARVEEGRQEGADGVWPRVRVEEGQHAAAAGQQVEEGQHAAAAGQQGAAAVGPEQGAVVQQGVAEGLVAGPGQCTAAAAKDDGLDWESVQSELLLAGLQGGSDWGEALWCFNPACANLEGPSELALKTYACGGGCGVRYCSRECQEEGWRRSHCRGCTAGKVRLPS